MSGKRGGQPLTGFAQNKHEKALKKLKRRPSSLDIDKVSNDRQIFNCKYIIY